MHKIRWKPSEYEYTWHVSIPSTPPAQMNVLSKWKREPSRVDCNACSHLLDSTIPSGTFFKIFRFVSETVPHPFAKQSC